MSDSLRKPLSDQVGEKITPDSQKSSLDQAKESVTGAADRAAGAVQPDSNKSAGQKLGDSTRDGADQGKGVLGQAQEALGNAAQSVKDTVSGTGNTANKP
ncbi:putative 12 kDa heat shock protein [Sporormia fimetaria CBS 119925]|uniref:Putative 12 kDa heat shock protein n=1 Tax=Sporormia fimetaria CBS 119925 TaxID=1340428 RepID=A0A6A6VG44_9PLEO|nr:putative 12 kDa heat shock protein [Sporormia fimetaria CBS 119925]